MSLCDNPVSRFQRELERARVGEAFDPTSAALATADAHGRPAVRFVLVKHADARGFVFYTNRSSPKARQIEKNPHAALAFHWSSIGVQVRVSGEVESVSDAESDAYFASRPRGSQLGAWASAQSRPLTEIAKLSRAFARMSKRFDGREVPRPAFWGGYRIKPDSIEFWYSRADRMHERQLYLRTTDGWTVQHLQP